MRDDAEVFQLVEHSGSRKRAFGLSVVVHLVLLTTSVAVPLIFTGTLRLQHQVVFVAPPISGLPVTERIVWNEPVPKIAYVLPKPLIMPPREYPILTPETLAEPEPRKAEPPKPSPLPKVVEPESIPSIVPVMSNVGLRTETPAPIAEPKLGVITNVFSAETAATPTSGPVREIQTSGFGATNGTTAPRNNRAPAASTILNGFGNVTGADRGGSPKADVNRNIRQGGFGDVEAAGPSPAPKKPDVETRAKPAEITFKPRPDYTEEARKLRMEGEVILKVLFTASSEVRILEVVRGLGHGLDENAVSAAQRIRFKPALRNGEAIDSTATVHIAFQLAY